MSEHRQARTVWSYVRVPFERVRSAYYLMRKHLFAGDRPSGPYFVVDETVDGVVEALGRQHWAPNWEFSYYKRGEVINQAIVTFEPTTVDGNEYDWWQTHVRGWKGAAGVELQAHWETEPTENANDHIDGVGYSVERGMENLRETLERTGLDFEEAELVFDESQVGTDREPVPVTG